MIRLLEKILWCIFFGAFSICCQGQFRIDFEQYFLTHWEQSPPERWEISSVDPLSGDASLHHSFDNSTNGQDKIAIPLPGLQLGISTTTWRFKVKHAYPPSSANNWAIFLLSSESASGMYPSGPANGYVLGVNFTGSDDMVKLWKNDSGGLEELVNTNFNWQTEIPEQKSVCFEVSWSESGVWHIKIDTTCTGDNFTLIGTGVANNQYSPLYFGIYYEYSLAQDMKFWFDDLEISGVFNKDTIPPKVNSVLNLHPNTVIIEFSEPIRNLIEKDTLNFAIGLLHPNDIFNKDIRHKWLIFDNNFTDNTSYSLFLKGMRDLTGNLISDTTIQFMYHIPAPYEIVINEIMADPVPSIGLPENEYVELMNTTDYHILGHNWVLEVGAVRQAIPFFHIPPGSYKLLVDQDDTTKFNNPEGVIGLITLPALLNTGQILSLYDHGGQVVSSIMYSSEWYGDPIKSEGGWSLEQIDPLFPCQGEENWIASQDISGGTPGRLNSVMSLNPDHTAPKVKAVFISDSTMLKLSLNEPYNRRTAVNQENFFVDQGIGIPDSVSLVPPLFMELYLHFSETFKEGVEYLLLIGPGITDCAENSISDAVHIPFGFPSRVDSLDLVINEILFNPYPGGYDFVELYNRSSKILNLEDLSLANRDEESNLSSIQMISSEPLLIFPGEYILLTTNIESIVDYYWTFDENQFHELESMPGYSNMEGTVVLLTRWLSIIDEFSYKESMHYKLLESKEGVSLEKIHPDLTSFDPMNWHSAAESVGFATPGLINSQFMESSDIIDPVKIEPEIFSPDNDGHDDVVSILYSFDEPGYTANITVFDSDGRLVRKLINNQLCGTSGSFIWNGEDEGGRRAALGIYIFFIEIHNLHGQVKAFKKTCVLAVHF